MLRNLIFGVLAEHIIKILIIQINLISLNILLNLLIVLRKENIFLKKKLEENL
ncbi:hypothetical protein CE91St67_15040 [Methanobrevibacter smithii]|nr:hypothetical protein CE91St67_15040 [Methanobrevibacter smithii]